MKETLSEAASLFGSLDRALPQALRKATWDSASAEAWLLERPMQNGEVIVLGPALVWRPTGRGARVSHLSRRLIPECHWLPPPLGPVQMFGGVRGGVQ